MSENAILSFSKAAKRLKQTNAVEFNPPPVGVGDCVHYYHGRPPEDAEPGDLIGGREPTAAFVAKILPTPGMLVLSAVEPDSYAFRTFDDGTRHVADPRLLHDLANDSERGFWTLRPGAGQEGYASLLTAEQVEVLQAIATERLIQTQRKVAA